MGVDVCVFVCGSYTAFLLLECCLIIITRDKIIQIQSAQSRRIARTMHFRTHAKTI